MAFTFKGDNEYRRIHRWIAKKKGSPDHCSINKKHITKKFHWANISREYLYEFSDWVMLCSSCHGIFDKNRLDTIKELRRLVKIREKEEKIFNKYKNNYKNIHPLQFYFPELAK